MKLSKLNKCHYKLERDSGDEVVNEELKIRFHHTHPVFKNGKIANKAGTTCIILSDTPALIKDPEVEFEVLSEGVARLCKKNTMGTHDQFSKKEGREASLRKALKESGLHVKLCRAIMGMECAVAFEKQVTDRERFEKRASKLIRSIKRETENRIKEIRKDLKRDLKEGLQS